MSVPRRAKAESAIAALAGYADDLPSSRFSKNPDLMAKLEDCKTPEERLAVIETSLAPKERAFLREYVAAMTKPLIGPAWLDEQERFAEAIIRNSVGMLAKEIARTTASIDDERLKAACDDLFEVGTVPWYASEILAHISRFRKVLSGAAPNAWFLLLGRQPSEEDRLWWIINAAMQLAMIWDQAKIDCAFGEPLSTGLRQRKRLGEGSRAANALRQQRASAEHTRWRVAAIEVWNRRPELSVSACASVVIKNHKLSRIAVKTVADRIRGLHPKKVG